MKIKRILYLLIPLFLFARGSAQAQAGAVNPDRSYFDGQLYIKFKESPAPDESPQQQLKNIPATQKLLNQAQIQKVSNIITPQLRQAARHYIGQHPDSPLQRHLRSLEKIYHMNYSGDIEPAILAAKLQRRPDIEYATPRYYHKLMHTPNDPLQGEYLNFHKFYEAWDVTTGSKDVVIGIIDSGIDYTHEDLLSETWINQDEIPVNWQDSLDTNDDGEVHSLEIRDFLIQNDEDFNGDGTIDKQDALADSSPLTTGGDTDGNGYNDDLYGWDFWQSGFPGRNRTQDNNPIGDHSFHGTHVAGVAGASTNNDTGVSGTGYNARVMAVKAGGIEDNPETDPNENQIIGFGYEGMLYAAMNGADIINTSWGGGAYSDFEKDLLNTVTDMGALVVAASGNSGRSTVIYPAAFSQTLAVGSVETDEELSSYSNYGYNLDVLATGTNIYGPMPDALTDTTYLQLSGTSLSAPLVSGLAALVKSNYPEWSGQRIERQIRVTSRRIDINQNENRQYQLGHGYVNAEQALSNPMPGLKIISAEFVNNQGQKLNLDEPGQLRFKVVNYGSSISNLNFQLIPQKEHLTVQNPTKQGLSVAHDDSAEYSFTILVESDFDLEQTPSFILSMEGGQNDYSDFHRFEYNDLLYDIIAANQVYTSFAANGTIGFTNALEGSGGVGFQPRVKESSQYETGPNLLFEGGLLTSYDDNVQDAVRSTNGDLSRDFKPLSTFRILQPGDVSDSDGRTSFTNRGYASSAYSEVDYDVRTYAFDDPSISKTVFLKYNITNTTYENRQLRNIYIGIFNDWDLGSVINNATGYVEQDSLLYAYDQAGGVPYYVGVAPLNPVSSQLAINNAAQPGVEPHEFGIYDGFTDTEKKISLKAGTEKTDVEGTDISTVVSSGPYHLGPRSNITVGFIYAYGNSLEELRSQVHAARQRNPFQTSKTGLHLQTDDKPSTTRVHQNYPNPFNSTTHIRIDLAESQQVTAIVYNVIGQKVATLANRKLSAGIHTFQFDGDNLGSGLYLVNVQTPTLQRTVKINLLK